MPGRQWLIAMWGLVLCAMLCGCSAFIDPEEPPSTWMPLPTRTPEGTAAPADTPTPAPPVTVTPTDVVETPEVTVEPVEGWLGKLYSLPETSRFDDYFRRLGGEGGQYGVDGADAALKEELAQWRDSERLIRVWGMLQRDVEDYGNVRVRVERLEVETPPLTPAPDTELVEGWVGSVHSLPPEAAYDDYFHAQSPSGQYGIASHIEHLARKLESYRDTGTVIRIWGVLDHGVADYGNTRILVARIEEVER